MTPMLDDALDGQKQSGDKERSKERETAVQAQVEYENGNYEQALNLLNTLNDSKAVFFNKLITQFQLDNDTDTLLGGLLTSEDLDLDQQVLVDYNRALALAKYRERYEEAIDLLDTRVSVLTESAGLIDESISIKACLLLAILYMERRKDPGKALKPLTFIGEKCDASAHPARLQQLKAKCYLQMNSTKAAKRELKSISGEPLIRSYLELQRSNFKKAMKIFSSCVEDSPLYHNNEALIQYGLGKRCTAVYHMTKAINNNSPEMLYNLGIVHLFTGNAKNAYDILYHLVSHYKNNPRVWSRLAECHLSELCQHSIDELDLNRPRMEQLHPNSDKVYRRIGNHADHARKNTNKNDLTFARGCLLNALTILNSDNCSFFPSCVPSEAELNKFKVSVLLSLAYVNQLLEEHSAAYMFAKTALELDPQDYQLFLAHLYAGDALVQLNQLSEAIEHFDPEFAHYEPTSDDTPQLPPSVSGWFPAQAKVVMLYNQAAACLMKKDFDKAEYALRAIKNYIPPGKAMPSQVLVLNVYLQLYQGSVEIAKNVLRHKHEFRQKQE